MQPGQLKQAHGAAEVDEDVDVTFIARLVTRNRAEDPDGHNCVCAELRHRPFEPVDRCLLDSHRWTSRLDDTPTVAAAPEQVTCAACSTRRKSRVDGRDCQARIAARARLEGFRPWLPVAQGRCGRRAAIAHSGSFARVRPADPRTSGAPPAPRSRPAPRAQVRRGRRHQLTCELWCARFSEAWLRQSPTSRRLEADSGHSRACGDDASIVGWRLGHDRAALAMPQADTATLSVPRSAVFSTSLRWFPL